MYFIEIHTYTYEYIFNCVSSATEKNDVVLFFQQPVVVNGISA